MEGIHELTIYTIYRFPPFELALRELCGHVVAGTMDTPEFTAACDAYKKQCINLSLAARRDARRRVPCDANLTRRMTAYVAATQSTSGTLFGGGGVAPTTPKQPYITQCPMRKPLMSSGDGSGGVISSSPKNKHH